MEAIIDMGKPLVEVKVVEIKPGLSICMDFSDEELQSMIDLIECYRECVKYANVQTCFEKTIKVNK